MIPPDEAWPDPSEHAVGRSAVPEADGNLDRVGRLKKAATAFRTISEVADDLHVPQHVLRFWETRFGQVKPLKRGGGRRYYRPDDVVLLRRISDLLYIQGYTIKGVQRLLSEGDGSLHGEQPPDAADAAGFVDAPDPGDASDPGDEPDHVGAAQPGTLRPAPGEGIPVPDRRPALHDDFGLLREAFRESLSMILAELEAIRRQLPG